MRERRVRWLLEHFWSRWRDEYLKSLRDRVNNLIRSGQTPVTVGDVVLVHDENNRSHWKLGRIISLHPSGDGVVRSVTLKTVNGVITRPIIKIVSLEINLPLRSGCGKVNEETSMTGRPVRKSAGRARYLISQMI